MNGEISADEISALSPTYFPILTEQGFFWPDAVDNCDLDPELELVQILIGSEDLECPLVARAIWQFTAIDECGNTSAVFEVVCDFFDTTPPVLEGVPDDVVLGWFEEVPEAADVTATDSCDDAPSVTLIEEIDDDGCPIVITRTWFATDACGNQSSESQTITIDDQDDPVIDPFPIQIWVECDEVDDLTISASDACTEIEITFEDVLFSGGCLGTIERTWIVTDACGNTTTALQFIIVQDTTPPLILGVGDDMEMDCTETPVMPVAWAEDNCGYDVDLQVEEVVTPGDCPQEYTITWTWTATDYCDNVNVVTKTVTVSDSTPPVFDNMPQDEDYSCDETVTDAPEVTATDDCGTAAVVLDEVMTPGACPQSFTITRTWTATDACENSAVHVQSIEVADTTPPVWDFDCEGTFEYEQCPEDVTYTIEVGTEFTVFDSWEIGGNTIPSLEGCVDDNCSDDLTIRVTAIEDNEDNCERVIVATFEAEDECGNIAGGFNCTYIFTDTTAPVFDEYEVQIEMPCDQIDDAILVTATDECSDVTITYEDQSVSGGCIGFIIRDYTAVDECGNESYAQQIINVTDNTPPVWDFDCEGTFEYEQCPEDVTYTIEVGTEFTVFDSWEIGGNTIPSLEGCVDDNCSDDLTIRVSAIEDNEDNCERVIVVTFEAEDDCFNIAGGFNCTYIFTDTTAPEFTFVPEGGDYSCDADLPEVNAEAEDNCSDATVSYADVTTAGDCPQSYTIVRTFTAIDDCGNDAFESIELYVYDNEAPVFTFVPADYTAECSDVLVLEDATATDNCGQVTVTSDDDIQETECDSEYTIIRTFYAEDECGNISDAQQVITVVDNTAPELSDSPEDVVLDCEDEIPAPPVITASDLCDGDVEVTFTEIFEGDFPDEEAEEHCVLINPESSHYDPDWAMWLQDLPLEYQFYQLVDGDWKQYDDGTSHLEATVVSTDNSNGGFIIDVWFHSEMNWDEWSNQAFPTSYKDDWGEAGLNYLDWLYYLMDNNNATLTGWGDFESSFFTLEHAPSNSYYGYQVGLGANNVNTNFGSGGWFSFEGQLMDSSTEYNEFHSESGDFAFDHDCCLQYEIIWTWTATDCAGNSASHTMNTSFENLNGDSVVIQPAVGCQEDFNGDGYVGTSDLLMLLTGYGCASNCAHDLNGDGQTDTSDILEFLTKYGTYCD